MLAVASSLNYCNHASIDKIGLAGGLLLMWKDGINCEIQEASNNMIHVVTKIHPDKPEVLITFMYGSTYLDNKKEQWEFMTRIS